MAVSCTIFLHIWYRTKLQPWNPDQRLLKIQIDTIR